MSGKTNDDTNGHPNPNLPVPKSRRTIRGSSKTEDTNEGKTSTIRRPSGRPPPRSNTNTTVGSPKSKRRPPPRPHDPPPRTNSSSDASDSSPTKGRLPPPGRGPKGFEQTSSPKSNGRPPVGRRRRPPNGPPQRKGPPVSTSTSEIIQFAQKHAQRIQSRPRYKPPTNPPPPTGQTKGKGGSPTKRRGSSNSNNGGGDKPPPPTGPPPKQRRSPTKSPTKLAPDPRRRPSGPPPGKGRNVEESYGKKVGDEHGISGSSQGSQGLQSSHQNGQNGTSGAGRRRGSGSSPPPRGRPQPSSLPVRRGSALTRDGLRKSRPSSETRTTERIDEGKSSQASSSDASIAVPKENGASSKEQNEPSSNATNANNTNNTSSSTTATTSTSATSATASLSSSTTASEKQNESTTTATSSTTTSPKKKTMKKRKKFGLKLTLDHSDAIATPRPTVVSEGKSSDSSSTTTSNESKSSPTTTKKKKKGRNRLGLTLVVEDSNHEPESPKSSASPKGGFGLQIDTSGGGAGGIQTNDHGGGYTHASGDSHGGYGMSDSGKINTKAKWSEANGAEHCSFDISITSASFKVISLPSPLFLLYSQNTQTRFFLFSNVINIFEHLFTNNSFSYYKNIFFFSSFFNVQK